MRLYPTLFLLLSLATISAHGSTKPYAAKKAVTQANTDASPQATVERGDPAEGGELARKIAGRYRHTFPNADVGGHHYQSTDTLIVQPVGAASIHFNVFLHFYNGHSCSLSGGALYRQDGSFVFDDVPANSATPGPACRLAIVPSATGLKFTDLNGGCKQYCGERGSWDRRGLHLPRTCP